MFDLNLIGLFAGVDNKTIDSIQKMGHFGAIHKSSELLGLLKNQRGIYFLGQGSFKVLNTDNVFLFIVDQGDLFGEFEVFDPGKHTFNIQLVAAVEYFFVPQSKLKDLFLILPKIRQGLMEEFKTRLIWTQRPPNTEPEAQKHRRADTIFIVGPKGGCGKTLVAANLAVCLAKDFQKRVLTIDVNPRYGNLRDHFSHDEKIKSLYNLFMEGDWNKESIIRQYIWRHPESGVDCLFSPMELGLDRGITSPKLISLVNTMAPFYDFVILDTMAEIDESNRDLIRASTHLLFIMELEYSSVNNLIRVYRFLDKFNFYEKPYRILLNRSNHPFQLKRDYVPQRILEGITFLIPSDGSLCIPCLNEGVPVALKYPSSEISEAFRSAARDFAGIEKPVQRDMVSRILDVFKF